VHDLHVWTVASGIVAMSGHATVPDLDHHPGVLAGIREALAALGIHHVTVQLEVADGCDEVPAPVLAGGESHGGCGHRH
jgi:cobalt-zinc-cadmium efflux system protein